MGGSRHFAVCQAKPPKIPMKMKGRMSKKSGFFFLSSFSASNWNGLSKREEKSPKWKGLWVPIYEENSGRCIGSFTRYWSMAAWWTAEMKTTTSREQGRVVKRLLQDQLWKNHQRTSKKSKTIVFYRAGLLYYVILCKGEAPTNANIFDCFFHYLFSRHKK